MMKLIIQIPCWNEEATLPTTVAALPENVAGFDAVEVLVVDDGSTDGTVQVAKRCPRVDHVHQLRAHKGLASAFTSGISRALELGADVIVNTDADNQYNALDIPRLVTPILEEGMDIVVGARPIAEIAHFSRTKKILQRMGSGVVRAISGTQVDDATSGFRAYSREAALRLNVFNRYTYTLETLIQAGQSGLRVASVPVRVNRDERPSRLVRSVWDYVQRSAMILGGLFMLYRPVWAFFLVGCIPILGSIALAVRWYVLVHLLNSATSHVPSLVAAAVLAIVGFQVWLFACLAYLVAQNRKLLEDVQRALRARRLEPLLRNPHDAPSRHL